MFGNFTFSMKTDIHFGEGIIRDAGAIVKKYGGNKVLLVADKGIRSTGLVDCVKKSLRESAIAIVDFDKIVPNPRISDCEAGAQMGMEHMVDVVVAVGGGSSIDTAKAIAGMLGHETTDFNQIKYPKPYTRDPYPLIAIPTTAGTGSEVTTCGVITDEKTHKKEYCFDTKCAPTAAVLDPEVLMALPTNIAAACGVDAMTHAIEGYVCRCTNPLTESLGLYALKLLYNNFRTFIFNRNIDTCKAFIVGSMIAGLSFGYSDVAAVHALAETVGGFYDIPHGIANAIFLADVCEYSAPANLNKYVDIARAVGVNTVMNSNREIALSASQEIRRLVKDVDIPNLRSFEQVERKDFEMLAERCTEHLSTPSNPRILTKADYLYLLNKAYES